MSVLSVQPSDGVTELITSNVDAVQDLCEVTQQNGTVELVAEPFTDHNVQVSIENRPPVYTQSQPQLGPSVTFDQYVIKYSVNACPFEDCPELEELTLDGPTVTIPSGERGSVWLPLVPLRTKSEFRRAGGPTDYDSYSATIRLLGSDLSGAVALEAKVEFTIGNYDNCSKLERN